MAAMVDDDLIRIIALALAASAAASMAPGAEDPIVDLWRQVLAHRAEASRFDSLANEARKRSDDAEGSRLSDLQKDADDKWQSIGFRTSVVPLR